jgi:hypothetical protein
MIERSSIALRMNSRRCCLAAVIVLGMASFRSASAAEPPPIPKAITMPYAGPIPVSSSKDLSPAGSDILQTGCSTCGSAHLGGPISDMGCASCGGNCVPGHEPCACCTADSCVGRFFCGLHDCICCPDPCYEPHWVAAADAAFFVDAARPVTQTRLRWDTLFSIPNPDRAEYFMARENVKQLEPSGPCTRHGVGKGPNCIASQIDVEDFSLYNEVASGNFSAFVEVPYREVDPTTSPISAALGLDPCCHQSGFADMNLGTKSLLLDCELAQVAFQFKTFIPIGNFTAGLGTGHVSLEPSLLYSLKLGPDTYWQGQFAYWISIGGDALYQGNIFHYHSSLNHVLWRPIPDVQLIGTAELNEWSVIGGNFTETQFFDPATRRPFAVSATSTMVSMGPGLRLVICDKIDFGVGTAFSLTGPRWAEEQVRAEFRWRF